MIPSFAGMTRAVPRVAYSMRLRLIFAAALLFPALSAGAAPPATATFAGGCFWCMEPPFEKLPGVVSVVSGYTGGRVANPTYGAVSSGTTGHLEAVEVIYDPARISYERLLDVFWRNIDPTDDAGQFCDRGEMYRPAIFFHDEAQRRAAIASRDHIAATKNLRIATEIRPAGAFYRAEEYHQDYYKKNPVRYRFYRFNCGRDRRLEQIWR
ncbi:MAG TPA: peptide-methionine (S)-S-oxide reductase MsrA [Thermoanaerobaculia bacterium]|nr:peptide-methionine (S)-S-oxide reductase MsrA [Thermoanaerobaculia bacterium]